MVQKAVVVATEAPAVLPVANRPLAAHALETLARAGVRQAAVVVPEGRSGDLDLQAVRDVDGAMDVSWVEHEREAGLPDALGRVEDFVDGEAFVLHLADSLSRSCVRSLLTAPEGALDCRVLVHPARVDDGVVELARRRLRPAAGEAAGVWVFGAGALPEACQVVPSGSCEADAIGMTNLLAEHGGRVDVHRVAGWWRFHQSPDALLEGNRFALEGLTPQPVRAHLVDTQIQGAVSIHPTARLESSIVRGPAIIGAGARLHDAYIGPYTAIGAEVFVDGAEIEHSIVLTGATICHLGGRLEASVVGPRARVFRDFRLPKALRLKVGEGAEISLA
jgi:glucose-1-phosphate thymidylyltransferase